MNCNIIKDLLPSYIDDICSEDTVKLVEEHIQHCEECKVCLNRMQQQTDLCSTNSQKKLKKPLHRLKKLIKSVVFKFLLAIVITFFGHDHRLSCCIKK